MKGFHKWVLYIACFFLFQQSFCCAQELKLTYRFPTSDEIRREKALISDPKVLHKFNVSQKIVLHIENAKPFEKFIVYGRTLDGKITPFSNEPMDLSGGKWIALSEYMIGEPCDIVAMSEDRQRSTELQIVPIPLQARSKSGRKISIEISSASKEMFDLKLEGFNTNEPYTLVSKSGDEILKSVIEYREGDVICLMPGVIGKDSGIAVVEVHAKNPDEVLKLEYDWGYDEAFRKKRMH